MARHRIVGGQVLSLEGRVSSISVVRVTLCICVIRDLGVFSSCSLLGGAFKVIILESKLHGV